MTGVRVGTLIVLAAGLALSLAGPAGAQIRLRDVSCAQRCTAVGFDLGRGGLAATWDGAAWTVTRVRAAGDLTAVDCPTARRCMAVGSTANERAVAARWNGKAWRTMRVPLPAGSGPSGLDAVSCASARACVALGLALRDGRTQTFTAAWNGSRWRLVAPRWPAGAKHAVLADVSCTAARKCVAVGSYYIGNSWAKPVTQVFNGRTWSPRRGPSPGPGIKGAGLSSVDCPTRRACLAVGSASGRSFDQGFAARLSGATWSLAPSGPIGRYVVSRFTKVACRTPLDCVAVGVAYEKDDDQRMRPLVETWDGERWSAVDAPEPPGVGAVELSGVACGAGGCMAVGKTYTENYLDDLNDLAGSVVLVSDGAGWKLAPSP